MNFFSLLIPLLTLSGMVFMEMSLRRVKNTGGWVPRDMIMPEQRCFFSTGMPIMLFTYCFVYATYATKVVPLNLWLRLRQIVIPGPL